jgi:hypothetical protein
MYKEYRMIQKVILEDLLVSSSNYALTTEDVALYNSPQYKRRMHSKLIDDPNQMDKLIIERFKELDEFANTGVKDGYDDLDDLARYKKTKEVFLKIIKYINFNRFPFISFADGGYIYCNWSCAYHNYDDILIDIYSIDKIIIIGDSYPQTTYKFGIMTTQDQLITKANMLPNKQFIFPKDIITWSNKNE